MLASRSPPPPTPGLAPPRDALARGDLDRQVSGLGSSWPSNARGPGYQSTVRGARSTVLAPTATMVPCVAIGRTRWRAGGGWGPRVWEAQDLDARAWTRGGPRVVMAWFDGETGAECG